MLKPGDTVPVTIDKPAAGGRMLARVNGQVVLVAGAIPGERVIARVDRVSKGVVFADTVDVDAPSPDRRQPFSDPLCGGCVYSHIAYARQLEIKGQIVARPMMYVALSYDHRIVDGQEAVQFLVRIKELVEDPATLLIEG